MTYGVKIVHFNEKHKNKNILAELSYTVYMYNFFSKKLHTHN